MSTITMVGLRNYTNLSYLTKIAINGYKKYNVFGEKLQNQFGQSIKVFRLPETSGSNASWTLEKLCKEWSVVFEP